MSGSPFKKSLKEFKRNRKIESAQIREDNEETDENSLFTSAMRGVKPLVQDTYLPPQQLKKTSKRQLINNQSKQINASFIFSDTYQAHFSDTGPLRYCREDVPSSELKRLRRGDYYPEYILDLHGLTKDKTKLEIAALIDTATKEWVDCVCIVHGVGEGVLKNALPHYLVQHPKVRGFHQSPLEYGGHGALLVLLDVSQSSAE